MNISNSLCESYRDTPLCLHHIVPIDFHSVETLPESHRWPAVVCCSESCSLFAIPVVDLNSPHVVEMLGNASKEWGIFQLIGHGVKLSLLEEVEYHARRLFALPAVIKARASRSPDGATGYGMARMSRFFDKFMWHEGFTIMDSSLSHDAKKLWPHDYQEICDVMDKYQRKMKTLSQHLEQLILDSLLGLLKTELAESTASLTKWSNPDTASTALQLNYYPPCPDPTHAIGLAPHTDTLLLTILHQDHCADGLQILKEGTGWISIAPVVEGSLLVNLGDLSHILSNGRYLSVMHRAVVRQRGDRLSVAYFYGPSTEFEVSPVRKNDDMEEEPARFKTLTVKDYVKMKEMYFTDPLSHLSNP